MYIYIYIYIYIYVLFYQYWLHDYTVGSDSNWDMNSNKEVVTERIVFQFKKLHKSGFVIQGNRSGLVVVKSITLKIGPWGTTYKKMLQQINSIIICF